MGSIHSFHLCHHGDYFSCVCQSWAMKECWITLLLCAVICDNLMNGIICQSIGGLTHADAKRSAH